MASNYCKEVKRKNYGIAKLPPKFDKSAVRSEKLKFHGIWANDLGESPEFPTPLSGDSCSPAGLATSDVKAVSRAEESTAMPDISDALKGNWPLDVGLTGISDMEDIVLFGGITGDASAVLVSMHILHRKELEVISRKIGYAKESSSCLRRLIGRCLDRKIKLRGQSKNILTHFQNASSLGGNFLEQEPRWQRDS